MSLEVVARIKAELEARRVSLVGPCGAFQIVKRVAWELRATGAGLLAKSSGNNCFGFAVDIIAFPDGTIFDVLANAGGDEDEHGAPIPGTGNVPTWSPPSDGKKVDPSRYRLPSQVDGDVPIGPIGPVDEGQAPAPAADELGPQILEWLKKVDAQLEAVNRALARPAPTYRGATRLFGTAVKVVLVPDPPVEAP